MNDFDKVAQERREDMLIEVVASLVGERDALRAEVERLRDERDRQYDQNTEQIVRIAALETEINKLRRMLHLADSLHKHAEAEVDSLRAEVAMYRSALANALEIAQPLPQPPEEE